MIGIIGAMASEVDGLKTIMDDMQVSRIASVDFCRGRINGTETVVAEAGIGKVNAAVTAQLMIVAYKPDYIINSGVAGGLDEMLNIGDVVVADRLAEHDMDTTVFGDEPGFISGINKVYMDCDERLIKILSKASQCLGINTIIGTIASGDQFISRDDQREKLMKVFNASAAEMEGAAIAHVCTMNNVPFGVIRAISDGANSSSEMDFPTFCKMAADNSIEIIKITLKRLGEENE